MDFEWVAIALGDVVWISLAFCLGFMTRLIGLPPLVGFLAAGFVLNALGITSGEMLQKLADLGVTLLLFMVGLKLDARILARPQVWAVTAIHTSIVVALFGMGCFTLAAIGAPIFSSLDLGSSLLVGFALSFSSTVFVVKILEDSGEMKSLHGQIAIGILIMQDIAAVAFLAASVGKLPSLWAILLFLLIPLKPFLHSILGKTGHDELMILYGLVLALGGAELFELVGVKDDLGALVMGVLISSHPKSKEIARTMVGMKDVFLIGFFLSIGMSARFSPTSVLIGLLLVPFVFAKSVLFFALLTRFKLRARTSLLGTLNLTNYSEFGLIVVAIGVANDWLQADWLAVLAIAASVSFTVASPLNLWDNRFYSSYRDFWRIFQRGERLPDDELMDALDASIVIFGMGRVGRGAYDKLREMHGETVVGIDFDAELVKKHQEMGRNVLLGDPSDADFWDKIDHTHDIKLVMLALPNLQANLDALEQLREISFSGRVAATAKYPDDEERLRQSGATAVFNLYTEAGAGFAEHVRRVATEFG